jgi:hypothetical protein
MTLAHSEIILPGSSKRFRSAVGVRPYYGGELTQYDLREPRFWLTSVWPTIRGADGDARFRPVEDELCLPPRQYFRAMADPSIRESQLFARP